MYGGDEAFTILTVQDNWANMWETLVEDVHPPLYYIYCKLITNFTGYSLQAFKILSILPIVLMNIIITILAMKNNIRKNNIKTGILVSLFIIATTLTSNFLTMGQLVRMYSLATLFVTLSGIYGLKLVKEMNIKNSIIFIIFGLCATLTHYFALIMEIVIYLFTYIALIKKYKKLSIKTILITAIITIIGYSWWLPIAINQFTKVSNDYWITMSFKNILEYFNSIFVQKFETIIYGLIIGILVCTFIYKLFKNKLNNITNKENIIFAISCIFLPIIIILIGIVLNIIIRPIFISRYMLPSLGLFWLGIIILIDNINYKKTAIIISSVLIIILAIIDYIYAYKTEFTTRNK